MAGQLSGEVTVHRVGESDYLTCLMPLQFQEMPTLITLPLGGTELPSSSWETHSMVLQSMSGLLAAFLLNS